MADKKALAEIGEILKRSKSGIVAQWRELLGAEAERLSDVLSERDLQRITAEMLAALINILEKNHSARPEPDGRIIDLLEILSKEATLNNISPSDTALFVFTLKEAIFNQLQDSLAGEALRDAIRAISTLVDRMGLITFETYMRSRETVIRDQQQALTEVSIPVVRVWDRILLLPLVGMIDSSRTQLMLESLLAGIEETQSRVAILDISGIPLVDSLVARHLIITVSAARLMGAECIITGISSRIAQTMVNLGVDLTGIMTRGVLADGLKLAFELSGESVTRKE